MANLFETIFDSFATFVALPLNILFPIFNIFYTIFDALSTISSAARVVLGWIPGVGTLFKGIDAIIQAFRALTQLLQSIVQSCLDNRDVLAYIVLLLILAIVSITAGGAAITAATPIPLIIVGVGLCFTPLIIGMYNSFGLNMSFRESVNATKSLIFNLPSVILSDPGNLSVFVYLLLVVGFFSALSTPWILETLQDTFQGTAFIAVVGIPSLILLIPLIVILYNLFFGRLQFGDAFSSGVYVIRNAIPLSIRNFDILLYLLLVVIGITLATYPGAMDLFIETVPPPFTSIVLLVPAIILVTPILMILFNIFFSSMTFARSLTTTRDAIYGNVDAFIYLCILCIACFIALRPGPFIMVRDFLPNFMFINIVLLTSIIVFSPLAVFIYQMIISLRDGSGDNISGLIGASVSNTREVIYFWNSKGQKIWEVAFSYIPSRKVSLPNSALTQKEKLFFAQLFGDEGVTDLPGYFTNDIVPKSPLKTWYDGLPTSETVQSYGLFSKYPIEFLNQEFFSNPNYQKELYQSYFYDYKAYGATLSQGELGKQPMLTRIEYIVLPYRELLDTQSLLKKIEAIVKILLNVDSKTKLVDIPDSTLKEYADGISTYKVGESRKLIRSSFGGITAGTDVVKNLQSLPASDPDVVALYNSALTTDSALRSAFVANYPTVQAAIDTIVRDLLAYMRYKNTTAYQLSGDIIKARVVSDLLIHANSPLAEAIAVAIFNSIGNSDLFRAQSNASLKKSIVDNTITTTLVVAQEAIDTQIASIRQDAIISTTITMPSIADVQSKIISLFGTYTGTQLWNNLINSSVASVTDSIALIFPGTATNISAISGLASPSQYITNILWESIFRSYTDVHNRSAQSANIDIGTYLGLEMEWLNLQGVNASLPWKGVIPGLTLPVQSTVETNVLTLASWQSHFTTNICSIVAIGFIFPGTSTNAGTINTSIMMTKIGNPLPWYYVNTDLLTTAQSTIANAVHAAQITMSNAAELATNIANQTMTALQNRVTIITPYVNSVYYNVNPAAGLESMQLPTIADLTAYITSVINSWIAYFVNKFKSATLDIDGINAGSLRLMIDVRSNVVNSTSAANLAKNLIAEYANVVLRKIIPTGWIVHGYVQPLSKEINNPTVIDIISKVLTSKLTQWQTEQKLYNMYNRKYNIVLGSSYTSAISAATNVVITAGASAANASSYATTVLQPALTMAINNSNSYTNFVSTLQSQITQTNVGSLTLTPVILTNIQNAIISAYTSADLNGFYADSALVNEFSAIIQSIVGTTTVTKNGVVTYINTNLINTTRDSIVSILTETQFDINNIGATNQIIGNSVMTRLQERHAILSELITDAYAGSARQSIALQTISLPTSTDLAKAVLDTINAIIPYVANIFNTNGAATLFPKPSNNMSILNAVANDFIARLRQLGTGKINTNLAQVYGQSMINTGQQASLLIKNQMIDEQVDNEIIIQNLKLPTAETIKNIVESLIASINSQLTTIINNNTSNLFLKNGITAATTISTAMKDKIKSVIFTHDLTGSISDAVANIAQSVYAIGTVKMNEITKPKMEEFQTAAYNNKFAFISVSNSISWTDMIWTAILESWNDYGDSANNYNLAPELIITTSGRSPYYPPWTSPTNVYKQKTVADINQGTYIAIEQYIAKTFQSPQTLLRNRATYGWHTYNGTSPTKIANYQPISSNNVSNIYEYIAKILHTKFTTDWAGELEDMARTYRNVQYIKLLNTANAIANETGAWHRDSMIFKLHSALWAGWFKEDPVAVCIDRFNVLNGDLGFYLIEAHSIFTNTYDLAELGRWYQYWIDIRNYSEVLAQQVTSTDLQLQTENYIASFQAKENRNLIYNVMSNVKTALMQTASGYDEAIIRLNTYINMFDMDDSLNQDFILKPSDAKVYKYTFSKLQSKKILIMSDYDPDGILPTSSNAALSTASLKVEDVYAGMLDILSSSNDPSSSANIFAITDTIFELISNGLDISIIQNLYNSDRRSAVMALFNLENNEFNPLYALKSAKDPGLANISDQFAAVSQTNTAFQTIVKQITPSGIKLALDAAPTRAGGTGAALAQFTEDIGGRYIRRVFYEAAGLMSDIYSELNSIVTTCITIDNKPHYVHQPNDPIDLAWMRYDLQNWLNPLRGQSGTQTDNFVNGGYTSSVRASHRAGIKRVLTRLSDVVGIKDTQDFVQTSPGIKQKMISLLDYLISYNNIINYAFVNGVVGSVATGLRNSLQTRLSPRYFRLDQNNRSMSLLGLLQIDYSHFHINVPLDIKKFEFSSQGTIIQNGLAKIGNIGNLSKFLNQFAVGNEYKMKREEIAHAFINKTILDLVWWPYFCSYYMYPTDNQHRWIRDGTYNTSISGTGYYTTWQALRQYLMFQPTGQTNSYFCSPASCLAYGLINAGMDMIYKELSKYMYDDLSRAIINSNDNSQGDTITNGTRLTSAGNCNEPAINDIRLTAANNLKESIELRNPQSPTSTLFESTCYAYRHDALVPYCFFVGTQNAHNSFYWLANNHIDTVTGFSETSWQTAIQSYTDAESKSYKGDMYLLNNFAVIQKNIRHFSWAGTAVKPELVQGFTPVPYYNLAMEVYLGFFNMHIDTIYYELPLEYRDPNLAHDAQFKILLYKIRLALSEVYDRSQEVAYILGRCVSNHFNNIAESLGLLGYGSRAKGETSTISAQLKTLAIGSSFNWLTNYTSIGSGISPMPNLPTDAEFYSDNFWSKMVTIAVWLRYNQNESNNRYLFQTIGKHQLRDRRYASEISSQANYDYYDGITKQYNWRSWPINNDIENREWDNTLLPPPPLSYLPFWKSEASKKTTAKFAALSGSVQQPDGSIMRSRVWCMLNFFQNPLLWFDKNRSYQIYPLNYSDSWLKNVTLGQYATGIISATNAYAIPIQTAWIDQAIITSPTSGGSSSGGSGSGNTTTTQINTTTTITSSNS